MTASLTVSPRRPILQQGMVAAVHLVAAIGFSCVLESWLLALMIGVLVVLALAGIVRLNRDSASVLCFSAAGEVSVRDATAERLLRPEGSSTDFGWAIWLHWRDAADGRRGARLLTRDQVDTEAWRRLRVWLRHLASVGDPRPEPGDVPGRAVSGPTAAG